MTTLKKLVEHVPPELEPEVKDLVEFLMKKHGKTLAEEKPPKWLKTVKRGPSMGSSASSTVESMRGKERC